MLTARRVRLGGTGMGRLAQSGSVHCPGLRRRIGTLAQYSPDGAVQLAPVTAVVTYIARAAAVQ